MLRMNKNAALNASKHLLSGENGLERLNSQNISAMIAYLKYPPTRRLHKRIRHPILIAWLCLCLSRPVERCICLLWRSTGWNKLLKSRAGGLRRLLFMTLTVQWSKSKKRPLYESGVRVRVVAYSWRESVAVCIQSSSSVKQTRIFNISTKILFYFWHFCPYCDRTLYIDRKLSGREISGSGKVCELRLELRTPKLQQRFMCPQGHCRRDSTKIHLWYYFYLMKLALRILLFLCSIL